MAKTNQASKRSREYESEESPAKKLKKYPEDLDCLKNDIPCDKCGETTSSESNFKFTCKDCDTTLHHDCDSCAIECDFCCKTFCVFAITRCDECDTISCKVCGHSGTFCPELSCSKYSEDEDSDKEADE